MNEKEMIKMTHCKEKTRWHFIRQQLNINKRLNEVAGVWSLRPRHKRPVLVLSAIFNEPTQNGREKPQFTGLI